jgi:hypothetical protein
MYGVVLAGIGLKQEDLLFHPEPLPAGFSFAGLYPPEQDFEELRIPVDGAELNALLFRQPASRGLVFYLHGNAGNLVSWTRNIAFTASSASISSCSTTGASARAPAASPARHNSTPTCVPPGRGWRQPTRASRW